MGSTFKSGPKIGWKTSFTFEAVGHVFVLGLSNIIRGEGKDGKDEEEQ